MSKFAPGQYVETGEGRRVRVLDIVTSIAAENERILVLENAPTMPMLAWEKNVFPTWQFEHGQRVQVQLDTQVFEPAVVRGVLDIHGHATDLSWRVKLDEPVRQRVNAETAIPVEHVFVHESDMQRLYPFLVCGMSPLLGAFSLSIEEVSREAALEDAARQVTAGSKLTHVISCDDRAVVWQASNE